MPIEGTQLEATVDIDASPAKVWALVGDPRNMRRWSPQLVRSIGRGDGMGATYLNINRMGFLVWPTNSKVVRHDPEREIAWRVKDNYTIWGMRLEPIATGTRVTQYREVPQGISDISARLTKRFMGGVPKFTSTLEADMATTLRRIKADAER